MHFKIPSIVLLTLFLVSCSGGGTNVKLEVSHNFLFGSSTALQSVSGGGLMVWGKSSTGDSFAQSVEDNDSINLNLSNGTWTFYAMAWDGSKDFTGAAMSPGTPYPLGGIPRCGISNTVTLSGAAVSVDLSINNSTCTDTVFKGSRTTSNDAGNVVLPPTTFSFCRGISNLTSGQDVCADAQTDVRQKERKAYIGSFKVKLKNYRNLAGAKSINGEIASKCIAMQGDIESPPSPAPVPSSSHPSFYGASSKKIAGLPAGGPGMPFYIEVEMFPGNGFCDVVADGAVGIRGSLSKHLFNGVASDLIGSHKYFPQTNVSNLQLHKVNLQVTNESICNGHLGVLQDGHPFAAGSGTIENPYLICSVPQFHAINSSSTYLSNKYYRLASDLDFNPYSKGLAGGVLPTVFGCLEDGSNFMPIGYSNATCAVPGTAMAWGTVIPFTGSFMGSGYKMSNLRLRAEETDNIAMFAQIQTGATAHDFGDFTLDKVEISGRTNVGALVGDLTATNMGDVRFWNFFAKNLDIESRPDTGNSNVGSLFGNMVKGSLDRIIVKKSEVRGDRNYVGGIVGSMSGSTLSEVISEVNIDADSSSTISSVGGVAGYSYSSTLQYVKHEGGIYTNGMYVGGIVGSADTGTNITNMYAMSFIYSGNGGANLKIGGIVGEWNSTGSLGPGYSLSSIKSNCATACQQGAVVGSTTGSTTSSSIYKLGPSETGNNSGASMSGEIDLGTNIVSDMRVTTALSGLSDSTSSDWNKVNGEYPRFDFENHPCTHGASGTGAGTLLSPIMICHEGQYAGISSGSSTTVYQLASNIRLSNVSTSTNDISTFSATLLGQGYSILAGNSAATAANSGHFGSITSSGKIFNVKYLGLSRSSSHSFSAVIGDAHGVLAATNNGEINNVEIWSFGNFTKFGSLMVGQNLGAIRKVELRGTLKANYEGSASFAVSNVGTIEDSKSQNGIDCWEGSGCDIVAGLAVVNSGTIARTEMGTHVNEMIGNPYTGNLSMLVDDNSGTLEDINVREYTDFRGSNGGFYFTRVNSGSLTRVMNAGRLLDPNNNYGSLSSGFPDEVSAADPDTGTWTDVWRVGAKSGKELLYEASFTCSTANVLTISAWSGIPDYSNWDTFFTSNYATDGKKLFALIRTSTEQVALHRIMTYNGSNDFGLTIGTCPAATTGKVTIYYTKDKAIDLSQMTESRVLIPQVVGYGTFSSAWRNVMWDESNLTHRDQILTYYKFLLGLPLPSGTTTPVVPKIWRLEGTKLDLFNMD